MRWKRSLLYNDCYLNIRVCLKMCLCSLDEAGPGPVKSKYDALDFDTLLKEAQKSMHRWLGAPDWPALVTLQQRPSDYMAPPTDRPLSTSMQGDLAKCLHFYHWNNETIRTVGLFSVFLSFFHRRILRFKKTKKTKTRKLLGSSDNFTDFFVETGLWTAMVQRLQTLMIQFFAEQQ